MMYLKLTNQKQDRLNKATVVCNEMVKWKNYPIYRHEEKHHLVILHIHHSYRRLTKWILYDTQRNVVLYSMRLSSHQDTKHKLTDLWDERDAKGYPLIDVSKVRGNCDDWRDPDKWDWNKSKKYEVTNTYYTGSVSVCPTSKPDVSPELEVGFCEAERRLHKKIMRNAGHLRPCRLALCGGKGNCNGYIEMPNCGHNQVFHKACRDSLNRKRQRNDLVVKKRNFDQFNVKVHECATCGRWSDNMPELWPDV